MKTVKCLFQISIAIFLCLCCGVCLAGDEESIELSVNVPFGITVGEKPIPVLDQAKRGEQIDTLLPDVICAVDKGEQVSGNKWYHIYYYSEEGTERIGTISGEHFELFTIEMLVEKATDPDSMAAIQALLALPEISATVNGDSTLDVDLNTIGFSRSESLSDETPIKYVLNTNTKKIHLPTCDSVDKIKLKNRKDIFDENELLRYIENGYKGCGNCKPQLPEQ